MASLRRLAYYAFAVTALALPVGANTATQAKVQKTNEVFCTSDPKAIANAAPSTIKMAQLLSRLASQSSPFSNQFLNMERAEAYAAMLPSASKPEAFNIRCAMGLEFLNAGETRKAIETFEEIVKLYGQESAVVGSRAWTELRRYHAVAYLRLGEQENCIDQHSPESCIMPIQGGGIHKKQFGSRKAIEILEDHLNRGARDRASAWLLNLAYMTLGESSDKVYEGWRIPSAVFRSDFDIKRFPDVAANLGLDVDDHAGGTITEDFDADGDLDIMISDWCLRHPMHYFVNNSDGTFTDRTIEAGLAIMTGGLNMVPGDFNNDGLPDVLVLRGAWMGTEGEHPDSLLRNDGNGHFTDITEQAGLMASCPNQTAVWFDYNGDGWLDIYFGYESFGESVYPCKLFRNNKNGTFTECAAASGVAATGFVKGVVSADYNNDGRPDLYLSRRGSPNVLYRNDGPDGTNGAWKFTDVSTQAGVTEPLVSFPTWFFDYDNDGWQDIFVSAYSIKDIGDVAADYLGFAHNAPTARLYRNNRDGTFKDVTEAAHLKRVLHTMGCNFGDFDNDGWIDFYLGTGDPNLANLMPNRAFRNAEGKFFQDVTTSGGFGQLQKGHGVSFADLDNDGDQDIYHSVGGAYEGDNYRNSLFENPGHGNHWITLKLEGIKSNRAAIGARIKVVVQNGNAERTIHRVVTTGGSFGNNPLRQEIGLANANAIKRIEIFWPVTGETQTLAGLEMDRFYRIREGDAKATVWNVQKFEFSKTPPKSKRHQHTQSGHSAGL